jgi:hypothetical protein
VSAQAERLAELPPESSDLFSAILLGVGTTDEQAVLVSKDGRRFYVNGSLLKASSGFFEAALENGMQESGKLLVCVGGMCTHIMHYQLKPTLKRYLHGLYIGNNSILRLTCTVSKHSHSFLLYTGNLEATHTNVYAFMSM